MKIWNWLLCGIGQNQLLVRFFYEFEWRPVHLYLNFEKSSLQNQVRRTGFLTCKKRFQNWFLQAAQAVKIKFEIDKNQVQKATSWIIDFKNQVQINRGTDCLKIFICFSTIFQFFVWPLALNLTIRTLAQSFWHYNELHLHYHSVTKPSKPNSALRVECKTFWRQKWIFCQKTKRKTPLASVLTSQRETSFFK